MSTRDAAIVISGGGPVGLGLAISLAQRNVPSIVVERYAEPQPIPRGQNLTQRTMEHFHFWQIEKELRAARTIPPEYGIGGMTSYGTLLGDYHYDWLNRALVRPFYFTDNERLPQYETEAVLRRRAAELAPVTLLYGCRWRASNRMPTVLRSRSRNGAARGAGRSGPLTRSVATGAVPSSGRAPGSRRPGPTTIGSWCCSSSARNNCTNS